ncbi:MAG: lipoyl synthase [Acidobacteria bacterium]|nr:lipoyl synthase [Acidobacteriota bacterium]
MRGRVDAPLAKPEWIKIRLRTGEDYGRIRGMVKDLNLHTVCEEARCPNIFECWSHGTGTFMIMGADCTRRCGFCAVGKEIPKALDPDEPRHVAEAVRKLKLRHAVITSVDRDDLGDGGAAHFARTIHEVRRLNEGCAIEVLIPDFQGDLAALRAVMAARPEILNHNMETVPSLYRRVRAGADYAQSLKILKAAAESKAAYPVRTKSGVMVGVGETLDEMLALMDDLRAADCDIMTIGQYLRPSMQHLPVERYYAPEEFARLKEEGLARGFKHVESGPLVRSSYHAHEQTAGEPTVAADAR